MATAGDVNGDRFSDVIIGADGYTNGSTNEGAAFVWLGDTSGINDGNNGNPTNSAWRYEGNVSEASLGFSVSTAGDVNGDGYSDVIVGAYRVWPGHDLPEAGATYLFHGSSTGLSTTYNNYDYGNQSGAWFGYAVAAAGDVNGDGYGDVIVSAPHYTNGETEEGRVYLWLGTPSGISTTHNWRTEGDDAYAHYGVSVATAGDVNGDGYSDVIIGAPHALTPASVGIAYVYHGSPGILQTTAGWSKVSNQASAMFGFSVSTAGDINGDGYADVLVGAPYWDGGQAFEGGAWVYHGSETGLVSTPTWHKEPNVSNTQFGYAVSTAGDVNGDGYDEVIIGAPYYHSPETAEGAAFVYPGSAVGLSTTPSWSKLSNQTGAYYGWSVSSAGDINADGYMDVIVGAPYWDDGVEDEGASWVYLGTNNGLASAPAWYTTGGQEDAEYGFSVGSAGDVNRDGFSDVLIGAPKWDNGQTNEGGTYLYLGGGFGLSNHFDWRQDSDKAQAQFGRSVGTAGDVNGDGYSDFIVGSPYWDNGQEGEGKVYVYAGSGIPLSLSPLWQKESNQVGAHYGWAVGCGGDVNGDGFADILVGAELWDGGEAGELNEGAAWVYLGSSSGPNSAPDWYMQGNQGSAHFGAAVGTAGDVNGDGYADVIVGAPLYNQAFFDEGRVTLYYGNASRGVSLRPRLRQSDTDPIAHLGRSQDDQARFELLIHTPFGRSYLRPQVEYKILGHPFGGTANLATLNYYQNNPKDTLVHITVEDLPPGLPLHWRIRWLYSPSSLPFMPASRWVTNPWNGWQEKDFLSGGSRIWIPLTMK